MNEMHVFGNGLHAMENLFPVAAYSYCPPVPFSCEKASADKY